jgi:ribulose-5-phosphate 4-epimerase/fuculose-1-phosphate aldolase
MSENEESLRRALVDVARHAETLGLVLNAQGNFSLRLPGSDRLLITPSGLPYRRLAPEDLVTVDLEGNRLAGEHEPSTEVAIHCLAYRRYPQVGGCAHVEPPYLNAVYLGGSEVPNLLGNFVYLFEGRGLAVAPPLKSASQEFAETSLDAMRDCLGVVWRNHGVFCVGPDLDAAFDRCVAAEQAARAYHLARTLRGEEPEPLPADVQEDMVETVRRLGLSRAL